jgi:hypothetical protein
MSYVYATVVILLTYYMGWSMGKSSVVRAFNMSLKSFAVSYVGFIDGTIRGAVTGEDNEEKIAQILDASMEIAKSAHVTLYKMRRDAE